MDASKIEKKQSTTISYVCRDSMGDIPYIINKKIGNHNILLAKALVIKRSYCQYHTNADETNHYRE